MRARSCLCCMRTLPAAPQWAPTHVALADAYSSAPKTTSGPDGETAKILCRVVATAERVLGKNLAAVLGRGDLALRLKGRRAARATRSEKSAEAVGARAEAGRGESPGTPEDFDRAKGRTERRAKRP